MRVLIVCARRGYASFTGNVAPFIFEQVEEIRRLGIQCEYYLVSRGLKGYLNAFFELKRIIKINAIDLIHAHYGLCGIIANFQRQVPVITTYHGSDINNRNLRYLSFCSMLMSRKNIVVSKPLYDKAILKEKARIIPCGVNASFLVPIDKSVARSNLGWDTHKKYVLFSKEFYNSSKNYPLAKAAVDLYNQLHINEPKAELIEFIGYSREQVLWLYNAVNCVIMTSNQEGSPQFIKEALACNCPIVSVDVGDVKYVISGVDGCFLADRTVEDLENKLELAMSFGKTTGREVVQKKFDAVVVARQIVKLYEEVVGNE